MIQERGRKVRERKIHAAQANEKVKLVLVAAKQRSACVFQVANHSHRVPLRSIASGRSRDRRIRPKSIKVGSADREARRSTLIIKFDHQVWTLKFDHQVQRSSRTRRDRSNARNHDHDQIMHVTCSQMLPSNGAAMTISISKHSHAVMTRVDKPSWQQSGTGKPAKLQGSGVFLCRFMYLRAYRLSRS